VLDGVERRHQTYVVTRSGKPIASHALLLAHAHRSGRRRGADDLVIAATALARGRIVVTADRGGFSDLPGVAVRLVSGSAVEG
jgi:predicted nucleic acid-binding protein